MPVELEDASFLAIRIPQSMKPELAKLASKKGLKLGAYIRMVLLEHIEKEKEGAGV